MRTTLPRIARAGSAAMLAIGLAVAPSTATAAPATTPATTPATGIHAARRAPISPAVASAAAAVCHHKKYMRVRGRRLLVSALCGRRMSDVEMVRDLRRAGWSWASIPRALATFLGESDGYVLAVHLNRAPSGRLLSTDLSWTQTNDRWHPQIRRINYADPVAAARLARSIARHGGLSQWHAYKTHTKRLPRAKRAVAAAHRAGVR